jgi:hypothetical protein
MIDTPTAFLIAGCLQPLLAALLPTLARLDSETPESSPPLKADF